MPQQPTKKRRRLAPVLLQPPQGARKATSDEPEPWLRRVPRRQSPGAPSSERPQDALPISRAQERLLAAIESQRVTIVVGETGSGKTTQLPQFLLRAGYASHGKIIGVTQPRRVAAVTVASRVAKEQGGTVGKKVGYSIRFDDKTSPATKVCPGPP